MRPDFQASSARPSNERTTNRDPHFIIITINIIIVVVVVYVCIFICIVTIFIDTRIILDQVYMRGVDVFFTEQLWIKRDRFPEKRSRLVELLQPTYTADVKISG